MHSCALPLYLKLVFSSVIIEGRAGDFQCLGGLAKIEPDYTSCSGARKNNRIFSYKETGLAKALGSCPPNLAVI